jgi:succinate dehydrogenase / fumarate reductase flavoprotein subunit
MARSEEGLKEAISDLRAIQEEFWSDVRITDQSESMNQSLEKAMRVADFLELAELTCVDALHREESCGGHFREEYQTEDGEALRNDDQFAYAAGWEWTGESGKQKLNKEELTFEYVKLAQRSYK